MTTRLRDLLVLDADTGSLFWRPRPVSMFTDGKQTAAHNAAIWNGRHAGKRAFTAVSGQGYLVGAIFGRLFLAHRVIFAMAKGRWPVAEVDHINGDPLDNRIENLREATHAENMRNVRSRRGNSSRFKGVSLPKVGGKWLARCQDAAGKRRHIGMFTDENEAARAYDRAAREWHGEFARVNLEEEGTVCGSSN